MLAYFFPPMGDGGVFRSLKLARYLPRHDWNPVVVCGRPEDYWIRDDSLLAELPEICEVHHVGGFTGQGLLRRLRGGGGAASTGGRRSSGLFRRLRALGDLFFLPDSYAGWIPAARRRSHSLLARGDIELIYSSGPPDSAHVAAAGLAMSSGLPWVADFRDPWFNLHLKSPPTGIHRALHRRLESRVLREAQVVTVTEGWRQRLAPQCARPPVLIRNGFDPADYEGMSPVPSSDDTITILHTGKLSLTRSARPFLEGLADLLAARPELRTSLRVDFLGPRESDNELAADALGLGSCVRWQDSVPHSKSAERQRRAGLLLLIKHDDPRYRDLVPGKFYEYVAAGRPILAVTPAGEIDELMERYRLGWTARPRRESVAQKLAEALGVLDEGWSARGGHPPELTRTRQAEQMAALFDELCSGRQGEMGGERL